jgi:hypothetical protein
MSEQILARPARSDSSEERRENSPCHSCYDSGTVVQDATYFFETGELIQAIGACPICHGVREISVYCYPTVRRSR